MINASDFVSLMKPGETKNFKLATVKDISQNNTAIILFDGEEEPSGKSYAFLDTYQANVGDRILLINISGTYVIIGKVQYIKDNTVVVDDNFYKFETIRTRKNLGDQAVIARRNKPYGLPDRLYNIYVENKIVKTATREYYSGQQSEWIDTFEVGPGTSVAISFDGKWELYRGKYGLVTKGNPYLFWVDLEGKLNKQIWNDVSTKEVLAENVVKVKSVRGWKNINFVDRDDGLIVGYIKDDGKVYYRNYCEQASGQTIWEIEREIEGFAGIANNINLFVTNDYRSGFIIEDNLNKVHWLITERNWAGMAIAPHTITVAPVEVIGDLIPIEYHKGVHAETITVAPVEMAIGSNKLVILNVINVATSILDENNEEYEDWGWAIEFELDSTIPDLTLQQVIFTSIETNIPIGMSDVESIGKNKYRATVDGIVEAGMNNILGDVRLTIVGAINPVGYVCDITFKDFTPINLVPEFIPLPIVEEVWNE